MSLPILYSFRRCPYAMRARFALKYAGISSIIREVDLKNKPESLIRISPKATVPVLQLSNGLVIDQSMQIVDWALKQKAEPVLSADIEKRAVEMIKEHDTDFVSVINRYKYRDLYNEADFSNAEQALYLYLVNLNHQLERTQYLLGATLTKADIALFPFVRQIAKADPVRFEHWSLNHLTRWLDQFLHHPLFDRVMARYKVWSVGDEDVVF